MAATEERVLRVLVESNSDGVLFDVSVKVKVDPSWTSRRLALAALMAAWEVS